MQNYGDDNENDMILLNKAYYLSTTKREKKLNNLTICIPLN